MDRTYNTKLKLTELREFIEDIVFSCLNVDVSHEYDPALY